MGIGNILVLAQVTAYVLIFLLSFFIVVPAGINQTNFDGNCVLFSTGTWHRNASSNHFRIDAWGDRSVCNFTIYIGIVSLMASFILAVRLSIFLCREADSSFLGAFLTLVANVFIAVMLFADCLVFTLGFKFFCRQLVLSLDSGVLRCSEADYIEWSSDPNLNTSGLIIQLGMTQFGCWSAWVCWVVVVVMSVIKLWKYSQHESFLRSIQREKDRLFGNYSQSEII
ncbi:transmembrane protein 179-like [Ptychodera flava]|uniref:transmembrane protein 179-like n=1 Tax=Ptychodera flava TaxID=63121 RepID=UPI00396A7CA0